MYCLILYFFLFYKLYFLHHSFRKIYVPKADYRMEHHPDNTIISIGQRCSIRLFTCKHSPRVWTNSLTPGFKTRPIALVSTWIPFPVKLNNPDKVPIKNQIQHVLQAGTTGSIHAARVSKRSGACVFGELDSALIERFYTVQIGEIICRTLFFSWFHSLHSAAWSRTNWMNLRPTRLHEAPLSRIHWLLFMRSFFLKLTRCCLLALLV